VSGPVLVLCVVALCNIVAGYHGLCVVCCVLCVVALCVVCCVLWHCVIL